MTQDIKPVIGCILIVIILMPLFSLFYQFEDGFNYPNPIDNENPIKSNDWDLVIPIIIDDTDPNFNWSKTASENDWCFGLGTEENPYTIENVTIDHPGDNCISIRNSRIHFKIKNCSVLNSGLDTGISLNNVSNGIIAGNNCSNNEYGILLRDCNFTRVTGNQISSGYKGITLEGTCNNNSILVNQIKEVRNGIDLSYGIHSHNLIRGNDLKKIHFYSVGIFVGGSYNILQGNIMNNSGIVLSQSGTLESLTTHEIDTTNLVNGKPIYYYANKTNLRKENFTDAGMIIMVNCNNSIISDFYFSEVGSPIMMYYSHYNIIQNITARDINAYGLPITASNNNAFLNNQFDNVGIGYYMFDSYFNTFDNNIVQNSFYGIRILGCINNSFTNNYIYNNSEIGFSIDFDSDGNSFWSNYFNENLINAVDNCHFNRWDNGSIGNFWDDYVGFDLNGDNIGDSPYNISGTASSRDNYPIFSPFPPEIVILKPENNTLFGYKVPEIDLLVKGVGPLKIEYTINNGTEFTKNQMFFNAINQEVWNGFGNGTLQISFHVNDSFGNTALDKIYLRKDVIAPMIQIHSPLDHQSFGGTAPYFDLSIVEGNLDTIWYTINNNQTIFFITELSGNLDSSIWNGLPNGEVTVKFFSNDSVGNVNFKEIIIIKNITASTSSPKIPGFNFILIMGFLSIITLIIWKSSVKKIHKK